MPSTRPKPRARASSMTPARLALMTAVGPPDWPTSSVRRSRLSSQRYLSLGRPDGAPLLQRPDHRAHEGRQIRRRARSDQLTIADDLAVDPVRAGVDHVVLDAAV